MHLSSDLHKAIERTLIGAGIPGCSLAILHRGVRTAWAWGMADIAQGRPVTHHTVFHLFSATKLYTAATIMRLVESGILDLEAPVSRYLPSLPLDHAVTLRQLASHASGLPETLRGFLAVHPAGAPAPDTAQALARYRTRGGTPPGLRVAYRNVNYAILGEVVSAVSGQAYTTFIGQEVLAPLRTAAHFEYTPGDADVAVGYIHRFDPMRWLLKGMMPALSRQLEGDRVGTLVGLRPFALDTAAIGGLLGAAGDFLPFVAEMLSPGDGVLRAGSKRAMLTLQARGAAGIASTTGVGLGWKLGRVAGTDFWNHEGGGPGFTSETRLYPGEQLGVVVLTNASHTRARSLAAHAICEAIRAEATART